MEEIDLESFLEEIDSAPVAVVALPEDKPKEVKDWDKLLTSYLSVPTQAIYTFAHLTESQRVRYMSLGWKILYEELKVKGDCPADNAIDPTFWHRLKRGWNSGKFARTIADVNRHMAFDAQCEFIPGIDSNTDPIYWCNKANYESVPIVPGDPKILTVMGSLFSKGDKGIRVRDYPENLTQAVVTSTKMVWRGKAMSEKILKSAAACKEPHQVAIFVGETISKQLLEKLCDYDSSSARNIQAVRGSIFEKRITQWGEFFDLLGHDTLGKVTVPRVLATLYDGFGFFGSISKVVYWLTQTSVLKAQNIPETIIEHETIPFYSNDRWPKDCVMYNATPVDITNYTTFMKAPPRAVVMSLTAAFKGGNHLNALVNSCAKVKIFIAFSAHPVVIFDTKVKKDEIAFNTNSVASNLRALEKEVVKLMLEAFKARCEQDTPDYFWEAIPDKKYGPGKCYINWAPVKRTLASIKQTPMSMDSVEKESLAPTVHASEIQVNGEKVSYGDSNMVASNYPRVMPNFVVNHDKILKTGVWYDAQGNELTRSDRPDLYGSVTKAKEVVSNKVQSVFYNKFYAEGGEVKTTTSKKPIVPESNSEYHLQLFAAKLKLKEAKIGFAQLDAKLNSETDAMRKSFIAHKNEVKARIKAAVDFITEELKKGDKADRAEIKKAEDARVCAEINLEALKQAYEEEQTKVSKQHKKDRAKLAEDIINDYNAEIERIEKEFEISEEEEDEESEDNEEMDNDN